MRATWVLAYFPHSAGPDLSPGGHEVFARGVFEEEATGPGAEGGVDIVVGVEGCKHQDPAIGLGEDDASGCEPVHVGHADVHEDNGGERLRASRTASSPSPASPTTLMSGSLPRITPNPARTRRWSSAMRTEISSGPTSNGALVVRRWPLRGAGGGGCKRQLPIPARGSGRR